jgi:hypothetical protein
MTSSSRELEQISRSQARQQILLIILCILVAASTIVTWKSIRATRETNEVQRQLLAEQADAPPKGLQKKRRASARPLTKVSAEPSRSPSLRRGQDGTSGRQVVTDSPARADLADTHIVLARPGRQ